MKRASRRTLSVALAAVAILAAACSDGDSHTMAEAARGDRAQLHDDMRALWEDHVTWTRVVIISAAGELADFDVAVGRLLRNQEDIRNAIKPFYGDAAGNELTRLLMDHIAIAGELLVAARTGDAVTQSAAGDRWYRNADDIAGFLAKANPEHWPQAEMTKMMRDHLDLTLEEAKARLTGDWAGDVAAYDKVVTEILKMSDMLADGIVAQFAGRFS